MRFILNGKIRDRRHFGADCSLRSLQLNKKPHQDSDAAFLNVKRNYCTLMGRGVSGEAGTVGLSGCDTMKAYGLCQCLLFITFVFRKAVPKRMAGTLRLLRLWGLHVIQTSAS